MGEPKIKAMILDVLRSHTSSPTSSLIEFTTFLAEVEGVEEIDTSLVEMDESTDSLRVVIMGPAIDYDSLQEHLRKHGVVSHSIKQVIVEKDVD